MLNMRKRAVPYKELDENKMKDVLKHYISPSSTWYEFYKYLMSTGMTEEEYIPYRDMSSEQLVLTPVYKNWFNNVYIPNTYENLKNKLDTSVENTVDTGGYMGVYRAMLVPKDYIHYLVTEGKHLGIYWTNTYESANDYYPAKPGELKRRIKQMGEMVVVLYTVINEKYVDWNGTFIARRMYPNENEITLFKNTPIEIKSISEKDGDYLDISPIRGVTFYA